MPFSPSDLGSDLRLWVKASDYATGSVTTLTDNSGWKSDATGTGATCTASDTPSGGKSLAGTNLAYTTISNLGLSNWTLVAAADAVGFGTTAHNAVDGTATGWARTGTSGWLRVRRNGAASAATSYKITPPSGGSVDQAPKTWTFEGSMDGSSWSTLDTRTNITWSGGVEQTFSFSNSTAYVFYRLNYTANSGSTATTITEFKLDGTTNAQGTNKDGELWVVLKSNGGSGPNSWLWGTSGVQGAYTFGGAVYDDFGSNTRRSATAVLSASSWRIYRVQASGTTWTNWIDNTQNQTAASNTRGWTTTPTMLWSYSGAIAEYIIVGRALTGSEPADMIGYLNAQHGLTVAGGTPQQRTYVGMLQA